MSGLAGADYLCSFAAGSGSKTSGLTGTWRAILSSSTVNAKDRITFVSGASIKNTNGDTVVASANELWNGILLAPPKYNGNGVSVSGGHVWTGTTSGGVKDGTIKCSDWQNSGNGGIAEVGDPTATSGSWLATTTDFCDTYLNQYLYCINSNN